MKRALPCSTDCMFQNTKLQKKRRSQWIREIENSFVIASDKDCVEVERRPDGSYNVVLTGRLAEKFLAANKNLDQLIGRNISEIDTFNDLLGDVISNFELNNPLPA